MAALRLDIFTRAAIAALVLLAAGAGVSQTMGSALADEQSTFSGQWTFSFGLGPPYEHLYSPASCIGSLVEEEDPEWLIVGICEGLWRLEGTATIDKAAGTVSLTANYSTVEFEAEGTLTRAPFIGAEQPGSNATLVFGGCKGRGDRGLVRCRGFGIGPTQPNEVDSIDAQLVLQHYAGLEPRVPCLYLCDVNVDGELDSRDAVLILQYVAGLIDQFPP